MTSTEKRVILNVSNEREVKEMTKKEMVITLREQDRLLQEIFQARKELAEIAKREDMYDEVWDMLYSDKQSHYEF